MKALLCSAPLIAAMTFVTFLPSSAQAEENSAAAWAITTFEVTAGAAMGLTLTAGDGRSLPLTLSTIIPMGLAAGAGVLAYRHGWSASPALAIHGAMWTATIFFLTTAAIEGTARGGSFHVGPAAYTIGGLGLIFGAAFGALRVGADAEPYWLGGPPMIVVGIIGSGVVALFGSLRGWSNRTVGRTIAFGTAGVGLIGLALGYVMATQKEPPRWMTRVRPSLTPTRGGAMVSLAGRF